MNCNSGIFYVPEPLKATFCGLFDALSVNDKVALWLPVYHGEKVTLTTQLAPGLSLAGAVPQVLPAMLKLKKLPLILHDRLRSATELVLLMVTPFVWLLLRLTFP